MANLNFYIDQGTGFTLVPPPEGWQNVELEVNYVNGSPDASIKASSFRWIGSDAAMLYNWFKAGVNGGKSIFEGPGFRIGACSPEVIVYDGCIDMTSKETLFQCDIVVASLKETNRIQNLQEKADSVTFSGLKDQGVITSANYIAVPYVISVIPDYLQVLTLAISFVEMYKLLRDAYHVLEALVDKIAGDVAAAAATGGLTVSQVIADSIIVTLYILYIIALVLILIDLIKIIINNIIQPIKYKLGMFAKDLCSIASSYLGYGFNSSILQSAPYNKLVIIPKKSANLTNPTWQDVFFGNTYQRKQYDEALNPNAYGYYEGSFAQLMDELASYFNGSWRIRNNTLLFERWDNFNNVAQFTMPNQSSDAPFDDPFGTNASELKANYEVIYPTDTQDENTINEYEGTSCQVIFYPNSIYNTRNVLLKGINDNRQLAFARAIRKTTLTVPEKLVAFVLNTIATFYNILVVIVNFFGGNLNPLPTNNQGNRIGCMLLSSDFTSMQKILVVDTNNKVDMNNCDPSSHLGYTDAYRLQLYFHSASWMANTFVSPPQYPNQYWTYRDKEIPLCCGDFAVLKNNNLIHTFDNNIGRLDSLRWNPHNETARVDFRVKKPFDKNIRQSLIIDGN